MTYGSLFAKIYGNHMPLVTGQFSYVIEDQLSPIVRICLPAVSTTPTTAAMSAPFLPRRHWTRFSNGHISTAIFSSIEFLNGIGGFLIRRHLDKSEAFASARVAIGDDLGGLNRSRLGKDLLE
jgi:hypothetical protein